MRLVAFSERVDDVLSRVSYPDKAIYVVNQGDYVYLRCTFMAKDNDSDSSVTLNAQNSRKWLLSPHMTDGEIVQTAFKCVMTAIEHETREQFRYRGQAIFGPHYDLEALVEACAQKRTEFRQEITA